ncbi:acyl-CoA dehydrogenase family protein [Streptomyces sp. NPDC001889]
MAQVENPGNVEENPREELLAAARALAPAVAKRAGHAEELRELPEETVADLVATGLPELLVPRRFGGRELDFGTLVGATTELARGCASTSWVMFNYALHNWMVAMYPEETQREVFAERPYGLIPATIPPQGRARPVPGGYRLTGRWSWASGVMHADWAMMCALAETRGGPEARVFLLPMSEVAVRDVWHTSGMRATGSNDMEVTDRYVPERRSVRMLDMVEGTTPGAAVHDSPLYRCPLIPTFVLAAAAVSLGTALALADDLRDHLRERIAAQGNARPEDTRGAQLRIGRAGAELRAARLLLDETVTRLTRTYGAGGTYTPAERASCRRTASYVVGAARSAADRLCEALGGRGQFLDSPFQRAQRDLNTLATHKLLEPDMSYTLCGRVELGFGVDPATWV